MDDSLASIPDNPYLLLTPGPLSTSKRVRHALLRDWCTWDNDYNALVQAIRAKLVGIATADEGYTSVLMQGSGTFSVEAAVGTMVPRDGKLLVLANGAYGQRIAKIAEYLSIQSLVHDSGETAWPDPDRLDDALSSDEDITHVAVVHCETTTGILNPVADIGEVVKRHERVFFIDAMSSFGGVPLDVAAAGADFVVSSANKCVQGVPGFGFCVARTAELRRCEGRARSLSLDLYDQWATMEAGHGKWRFTSPTHVVRGFYEALLELDAEGGVAARCTRYRANHDALVAGMRALGFECLLEDRLQSPIITAFRDPAAAEYRFTDFYERLKARGFVIYPGKVTTANTFRIGNIGEVCPDDIERLLQAVKASMYWV